MFWFIARAAFAQVEICPGALTLEEWREAMDSVDAALIALDGDLADRILGDIITELTCLRTPAPPDLLGRLARQLALVSFYAQDADELRVWAQLARETVGAAPWPEELPVPERFFTLIDAIEEPILQRADGALDVPKGGAFLLDGFLLEEPVATDPVQHLLQIADKRGEIVLTDWQNGADFPKNWLTDAPVAISVPAWYRAPPPPIPRVSAPVSTEPAPITPDPAVRFDGERVARCPWKTEPNIVIANKREVRVNRHTYPVRTEAERATFRAVLRACGELRAARRFTRWQAARHEIFGGIFSGVVRYRKAMVTALVSDEPVRRNAR